MAHSPGGPDCRPAGLFFPGKGFPMRIDFPPVIVMAPKAELWAAALKALRPIRRGKYLYWQDEDGRIYLLNHSAVLAAGAAYMAGLPYEQWMPAWRRRFKLREVVRA